MESEIEYGDWFAANREYLVNYIEYIKRLLVRLQVEEGVEPGAPVEGDQSPGDLKTEGAATLIPEWSLPVDAPSALENIARIFNLSDFEKTIIVLCAGAELDGEVSALCSKLYNNSEVKFPTFDIALRGLPGAEWEAFLPSSNLRLFSLINIHGGNNVPVLTSPIRIPEKILHYLLGFKTVMDENLANILKPVRTSAPTANSHRKHIQSIVESSLGATNGNGKTPVINLWGHEAASKLIIAQRACQKLRLGLWRFPGEIIPTRASDEQWLSSILSRECFLSGNAVYIDAQEIGGELEGESGGGLQRKAISRFAENSMAPLVFIGTNEPWTTLFSVGPAATVNIEVKRPTRDDQFDIWRECFRNLAAISSSLRLRFVDEIPHIVERYYLDSASAQEVIDKLAGQEVQHENLESGLDEKNDNDSSTRWGEEEEEKSVRSLYSLLENSSYKLTRNKLGGLAEEIIPIAKIDDIILPANKKRIIQTISMHFRHRRKVYEEWGFAKKSGRGLGIIALFSGESGTGKTMAAEAIANDLETDLYRIDLSMVASKYIGETEKNLKQIFDAAETRDSILFFDEADSLFGKRSEVRDSHDRYANMQVGYLLQRIESYGGIVILATNFKKSLDPAFMRRIRFIVDFPFPDVESREEIWRRIFPHGAPLSSEIDFKFLSRLSLTGGSIRNIALSAAFFAAEDGKPVSMPHIKKAAEDEYIKLGRAMSTAEIGNWP